MPTTEKKSLLVVVRRSPYGSSLARTSLEVALSGTTFGQNIGVLFMGDGVFHLLPGHDSGALGIRNIAKLIASFPLYELDSLFADETALRHHGIAQHQALPQNIEWLDTGAIAELLTRYDHIMSF